MTDEKLKTIISELESRNEKEKAYFGFYQYGGGIDESCMKANRQGLELFACELLKASLESQSQKENKPELTKLDTDWTDENGDFFFDFVELTNREKEPDNQTFPVPNEGWDIKYVRLVGIVLVMVLICLIITGLMTALSWI